ncbi:MAG: GIY-YIG nuclease family protein [Chloroflexi bacterium]|nr:GIY-YIG nuclease family protein [Chloroflexota bacterium]
MNVSLPAQAKGSYALVFFLDAPLTLTVGKLGQGRLPAGWLVYVGSAMGPGGVRARLLRHFRREKRLHWHIDALSTQVTPLAALVHLGSERFECVWGQRLARTKGAIVPMRGFGSSDCRAGCEAHLLAFPDFLPPLPSLLLTDTPPPLLYCQRKRIFSSGLDPSQLQRFLLFPP